MTFDLLGQAKLGRGMRVEETMAKEASIFN